MPNDWLKEYAPWVVAIAAPVATWLGVRRKAEVEDRRVAVEATKTSVEADQALRSDLRETERYLRQQLREVEADNKSLRAENLDLRAANLALKAEFDDFRRDTARELSGLREQLQEAIQAMNRGRAARESLEEEVERLRARVQLGEDSHS